MTRLIDADAINPMRVPQSVKEMRAWIDSQPTVEAIPVDFIRSEIKRMKEGSNRYYSECEAYAEDLDILLMEWERRQ